MRKALNTAVLLGCLIALLTALGCGGGGGGGGAPYTPPQPAITVDITPAALSLNINQGQQFTAAVSNSTNVTVNWSVRESSGGAINSTGMYTAPGVAGTYHVTATSQADATKSATATITVNAPAPTITSTPPTAASEGVAYTYTPSATDPAGTAISYQLTSSPSGATISGTSVTWTPTFSQSRVSNAFTLKAITAAGGTTSQSWTLIPSGSIHGSAKQTFVGPGDTILASVPFASGSAKLFFDLSKYPSAPDSTATPLPDGTYTLAAAVGPGKYWLQHAIAPNMYVNTDVSSPQWNQKTFGRSDQSWITSTLSYNVSGLVPFHYLQDLIEVFSPGANHLSLLWNFNIADGATSGTGAIGSWRGNKLDAASGDQAWVTQLSAVQLAGKPFNVLTRSAGPFSLTSVAGGITTLNQTLDASAPDKTIHLVINGAAFASIMAGPRTALAPGDAPSQSFYLTPIPATVDSGAFPDLVAFYNTTSGSDIDTDTDFGTVTFKNPFPASWPLGSTFYYYFPRRYYAPGALFYQTLSSYILAERAEEPTATNPVRPVVGLVTNPTINGVPFTTDQSGIGSGPVTIRWSPPAVGTADYYEVAIYEAVAFPDRTTHFMANSPVFLTTATQLDLPAAPVTLPGSGFVVIIRAIANGGDSTLTDPFKFAYPFGKATLSSGLIVP